MKKLITLIISAMAITSSFAEGIVIKKQGQFPVGGTTIQRDLR